MPTRGGIAQCYRLRVGSVARGGTTVGTLRVLHTVHVSGATQPCPSRALTLDPRSPERVPAQLTYNSCLWFCQLRSPRSPGTAPPDPCVPERNANSQRAVAEASCSVRSLAPLARRAHRCARQLPGCVSYARSGAGLGDSRNHDAAIPAAAGYQRRPRTPRRWLQRLRRIGVERQFTPPCSL